MFSTQPYFINFKSVFLTFFLFLNPAVCKFLSNASEFLRSKKSEANTKVFVKGGVRGGEKLVSTRFPLPEK